VTTIPLPSLALAAALVLGPACAADSISKEEARSSGGKADSADLCAEQGWYGDDECDTFCPKPDPDCADCPDPLDPGVLYVSDDPLECAALLFQCPDGQETFNDECGCGCIDPAASSCPDPADPAVHYIGDSRANPGICTVILFACEDGQAGFSDECGCGCIDL
jgi:hypothetical protein